jgi:hypothetical protein
MQRITLTCLAATALACPLAHAQPEIIDLGVTPGASASTAYGISDDGSVVVGGADDGMYWIWEMPWRWTEDTGIQALGLPPGQPFAYAHAVSSDGATVLVPGGPTHLWTLPGGYAMPIALPAPGFASANAYAISRDGGVLAGNGGQPGTTRGFRWTPAGGLLDIGSLGEPDLTLVRDMSADGSVLVGSSNGRAFRWTLAGGITEIPIPAGARYADAQAVSDDGTVAAVYARVDGKAASNRWTAAGGHEPLGVLAGTDGPLAMDISGDGTTVVGLNELDLQPAGAMLWRADLGTLDLQAYLDSLGADTTGWRLLEARAASRDGSAITGTGVFEGVQRAYLVRGLPVATTPCRADLDGDGELTLFDFLAFQNLFDAGDPIADFDGDGELTIFDFLAFQNAFDAGCG